MNCARKRKKAQRKKEKKLDGRCKVVEAKIITEKADRRETKKNTKKRKNRRKWRERRQVGKERGEGRDGVVLMVGGEWMVWRNGV